MSELVNNLQTMENSHFQDHILMVIKRRMEQPRPKSKRSALRRYHELCKTPEQVEYFDDADLEVFEILMPTDDDSYEVNDRSDWSVQSDRPSCSCEF